MPARRTIETSLWLLAFATCVAQGIALEEYTYLADNGTTNCTSVMEGPYHMQELLGCVDGDGCKNYTPKEASKACALAGDKCGGATLVEEPQTWQIRSCRIPSPLKCLNWDDKKQTCAQKLRSYIKSDCQDPDEVVLSLFDDSDCTASYFYRNVTVGDFAREGRRYGWCSGWKNSNQGRPQSMEVHKGFEATWCSDCGCMDSSTYAEQMGQVRRLRSLLGSENSCTTALPGGGAGAGGRAGGGVGAGEDSTQPGYSAHFEYTKHVPLEEGRRCSKCSSDCQAEQDCIGMYENCAGCGFCRNIQNRNGECWKHSDCKTDYCFRSLANGSSACLERVQLGQKCFENEHCLGGSGGKKNSCNPRTMLCQPLPAKGNGEESPPKGNGGGRGPSGEATQQFQQPHSKDEDNQMNLRDMNLAVVVLAASAIGLSVAVFLAILSYRVACLGKARSLTGKLPADTIGAPMVYEDSETDLNDIDANAAGFATSNETVNFPQYWISAKNPESTPFNRMVYVSKDQLPKLGGLLSQTFRPKATQDRPCPSGTHPRTPGGCECVQVGGNPGLPVGYQVRRAIRVESSSMWRRYLNRRQQIESKRDEPYPLLDPPAETGRLTEGHQDMFEPLSLEQNEVYIWHGTPVRKALAIAQDRFKINMAGATRGDTMYGPGAYFAESSTKADEYAMDEPGGYYEGVYALLLCRACLGRFYYTSERNQRAHEQVESGEFDSTLGDRLKSADTFREFVIYDSDQIYPEYVVLYSRVANGPMPSLGDADFSFHTEVPVYWRNCRLDPHVSAFHDHYKVRKTVMEQLQRLVDNTHSISEWRATVLQARRVENSSTWKKYIDFKSSMHRKLQVQPGGRFARSDELLAGGHSWSQVLTDAHLAHESFEEAISLDNFEESLNEHMVWHGTDRDAAEAIAYDDFRVSWASKQHHGKRFGEGLYFSDSFDKSVTYTTPDAKDIRCVLLCRMLCGDMYYTEEEGNTSATDLARQKGKASLLANPTGFDHEFVAFTEDQVYPEYILEFRIERNATREKEGLVGYPALSDPIGLADGLGGSPETTV